MRFKNRKEAGIELGEKLQAFRERPDARLFALPRGGVIVGADVSKRLRLPLDIVVTRKIGAPGNEEYAIGVLSETGELVWNEAEKGNYEPSVLEKIVEREKLEAARRVGLYREGRALGGLKGATAIVIDDGVATGLTMLAAVITLQKAGAARVVVAVPHGAPDSLVRIRAAGAEVVALEEPAFYGSVGSYYDDFSQIGDEEALRLLGESRSAFS